MRLPVCMQSGSGGQNDEIHDEIGKEHAGHGVGARAVQFPFGRAFAFGERGVPLSLFLHFLGCLPKEKIGRNRGAENCHQHCEESAGPFHARQERLRKRVPPIDVSEKRSQHVGEQNERHPLENSRHQLVRTPEQKRQDAKRVHGNPDVRPHAGDKLGGLRHAAEIRADVDHVGDNQNRAGAPQHPTRIISPHRGPQAAPGDHR